MRYVMALLIANFLVGTFIWQQTKNKSAVPLYKQYPAAVRINLLSDVSDKKGRCLLMGPISDSVVAARIESLLSDSGVESELVVQPINKAPGYWVYFGPISTEELALGQLRKFRAQGIDSFIIRQGNLVGSISLGVFENIDSAMRMIASMERIGYSVQISEIKKAKNVFWLRIIGGQKSTEVEEIGALLGGEEGRPEMRQIFCKTVASENPFP